MNDVLPVTIILPTLNERDFIRGCLESLLRQTHQNIVEILVIDGGSTDGTQDLARRVDGPIRVIHNPKMTAAAAMNLGIANCSTEVFVRVDCHSLYVDDYVSRSVQTFLATGATVVGGPMRAQGTNPFGEAVATVTSSPFGIGNGKFHYANELTEVETVYLGIFDKRAVLGVGGYDEDALQWAAEDQELNFRLRRAGGRVLLDPAIRSVYFPRDNPRALARQYRNYGLCKASTLKKHRTLPYWRPLVPAGMVAGSISWSLMFAARRRPSIALVPYLLYGVGATVVATGLSRRSKPASFTNCLMALAICQWSYGIGFLEGMIRIVTKQPFDSRPREGRR
jgi:succinoglycan biosynthesis protein ExoA